jgi:DNA polymerase iota
MTCQVKHERVYVHVDCDCFYAQCEELRDPKLSKVPLGVTQKYLIVTCNYHARGRGVTKLMSIDDAVKKCPELVLVDGSDLTPYKAISDQIVDLLHVYGNVKRLGCDEMFVDVTDQVIQRTPVHNMDPGEYVGHMWLPGSSIQQESIHRVMDLRAKGDEHKGTIPDELMDKPTTRKLIVGSQVARDMRRVVMSASNIRMSAGIATSQIMAKLISGLHKPNDQTILLPEFAMDFLKDLPVRVILGVGRVLSQKLAAHGIVNVSDLWSWSKERIVQEFGERQGMFLYMASQGMDQEGALIHGSSMEPKTISLEDSLRLCSGFEDSKRLLLKLAPDLVHRIDAHFQKYGKVPTMLTVTYRMKEAGMHERHACSTKIPKHIHTTSLVDCAMSVLKTKLHEPFHLSLLNIAAKNFHHASSIDLDTSHDGPIKSKREIRMTREAGGLRPPPSSHEGDDESFWRDLNDVGLNSNAIQHTSTRVLNKRPSSSSSSQRPLQGQRKKITSFFQKK